jgi:hypothetical protein
MSCLRSGRPVRGVVVGVARAAGDPLLIRSRADINTAVGRHGSLCPRSRDVYMRIAAVPGRGRIRRAHRFFAVVCDLLKWFQKMLSDFLAKFDHQKSDVNFWGLKKSPFIVARRSEGQGGFVACHQVNAYPHHLDRLNET